MKSHKGLNRFFFWILRTVAEYVKKTVQNEFCRKVTTKMLI